MKNIGPSFTILSDCTNCKHLTYFCTEKSEYPGCGFLTQPLNESKDKRYVNPHEECPFLKSNKEIFYKDRLASLEFEKLNEIEKIIKELFSNWIYYSLYDDTGTIKFRVRNVNLTDLIRLKEQVNRKITIQPYDSTGFDITLTKELKI